MKELDAGIPAVEGVSNGGQEQQQLAAVSSSSRTPPSAGRSGTSKYQQMLAKAKAEKEAKTNS